MDKCKFPVTYPTRSNNRALFNFLATPLTNIRVLDQTTTKLLVQLGLECITSQYQQFNLSFQNFRSYVNSLEKNETNKTNVTRKKFEDSILNRYFFRAANNNIYDIKSTDISTIGLLMLVKQSVVIDQTFATFSLTPKSINAVYNELYTEQQIIS
ncbi:hypothetical protein GCM10022296_26280 [Secundilactobacillus similis DSM 23365 = JCM 2765]|uniref:Uncharacterized protein n=3 Tax=Secundilactobacillus similis TaxID=414682 RepID=A0A0R2FES3_9LACO|nr:hypothetical protein FD14_GL000351 [Secundilactobacillus similis DSM 23365 = JCM 2765]